MPRLAAARLFLPETWKLKTGRHDIASAPIAGIRLTLVLLAAEPTANYAGRSKTLRAGRTLTAAGNVSATWDVDVSFADLRERLPSPEADFIEALVTALDDRATISVLDRYPVWRDQPLVPLDRAWPVW